MSFTKSDMEFSGVNCDPATESEQDKLNEYVDKIYNIIFNT